MAKITAIETFQLVMGKGKGWMPRGAFVRISTADGLFGLGEASPMLGGHASLNLIAREMAGTLIGEDVFDSVAAMDRIFYRCVKLGPDGIVTGALAALDIALWDLRGKLLGQPVHRLLGGARRRRFACYSSIGGIASKDVDAVLRLVEARVGTEGTKTVKLRLDGDRTKPDTDPNGDIEKARAVRRLLGDGYAIAFDANNGYTTGTAIRVGRALEELGFAWFEEPVQHYNVTALGELSRKLDITVSAGEQTYTLQGVKDLIAAGVRMVQPDIVKMGGITGMMQCAALALAHGVELVPHQTQPSIGHLANIHVLATLPQLAKPVELADDWERASPVFVNPSEPVEGHVLLPDAPGLGAIFDADEMDRRTTVITV